MFDLFKRISVLFFAAFLFLATASGCIAEPPENAYMRAAAKELINVLWNVDYETFTPEKTTAFAKKYYDKDFLRDYQSDIMYNAGVESIKEEKLKTRVLSIEDMGASTEDLGNMTFKKYRMKCKIEILSYKPVYPEESVFEEAKQYDLIFTLYFSDENGTLKLSAFGYEPENGAFLPKKANNVPLSDQQKVELSEIAKQYAALRYQIDYQSYDPKKVMQFYENNASKAFLEKDDLNLNSLNQFFEEMKKYKIKADIVSFEVLSINENKTPLDLEEGMVFYYLVPITTKYRLAASPEYFEKSEIKEGDIVEVREILGFDFENGKPKIVFAEYE